MIHRAETETTEPGIENVRRDRRIRYSRDSKVIHHAETETVLGAAYVMPEDVDTKCEVLLLLAAMKRLYEGVSVRWSVGPSVRWSVKPLAMLSLFGLLGATDAV